MNRFKEASVNDLSSDLVNLVQRSYPKKGLLLYGLTGRGKTHALYAIRKRLIDMVVRCSDVENWVMVLFELKDSFNRGGVRNNIKVILEKDAVFIDDLGAEKQSEWSQEMFYLVINESYENCKPLFISTNLTIEQLENQYGERIVSRLAEMCEFYEIIGEDKRTK